MRKINRRNFMKAMGKTVLLATAAGTLGACGAKIPVRDKEQIKEDVLQKDSTYSRYDHPEMPFRYSILYLVQLKYEVFRHLCRRGFGISISGCHTVYKRRTMLL